MSVERSALSTAVLKGIDLVKSYTVLENSSLLADKMNGCFLRNILGYYDKE